MKKVEMSAEELKLFVKETQAAQAKRDGRAVYLIEQERQKTEEKTLRLRRLREEAQTKATSECGRSCHPGTAPCKSKTPESVTTVPALDRAS
jgi:hypothetical protein